MGDTPQELPRKNYKRLFLLGDFCCCKKNLKYCNRYISCMLHVCCIHYNIILTNNELIIDTLVIYIGIDLVGPLPVTPIGKRIYYYTS